MKREKKPKMQVLVFVDKWGPANVKGLRQAYPVKLLFSGEVVRLWTLFQPKAAWGRLEQEKDEPPALPIVPVHGENAFLEDRMHNWNIRSGQLHYYSRIANGPVWVLMEVA